MPAPSIFFPERTSDVFDKPTVAATIGRGSISPRE